MPWPALSQLSCFQWLWLTKTEDCLDSRYSSIPFLYYHLENLLHQYRTTQQQTQTSYINRLILHAIYLNRLIHYYMLIAILSLLLLTSRCNIIKDLIDKVPGYPADFNGKIYSGYLKTGSPLRSLYYIFIENTANSSLPVTLWLNGGPGCSSLIGFLQQIAPFYLPQGQSYTPNTILTPNPYTWFRASHLLFLESPAGVGYSLNDDPNFQYNDATTTQDNLDALLTFFVGFSEYGARPFWLAGQSYAGKYIPDLALKIIQFNNKADGFKFNLQGMLVGNGIMSFNNGQLFASTVEFMDNHDFVDPQSIYYFRSSCQSDPLSAGCRYFTDHYQDTIKEINYQNIYGYCFYNDTTTINQHSQQSILKHISLGLNLSDPPAAKPCSYTKGIIDYFNLNNKTFKARNINWNGPCADNITAGYALDVFGSLDQYRYILAQNKNYSVVLYNGNADSTIPYLDTLKNIDKLNLLASNTNEPFFVDDQHAGWNQTYSRLQFIIIKGGSHTVVQSKRSAAYYVFSKTVI